MSCEECSGSGVVNWTCSEGTCDMTEWCECPAGDQARADYALVCAEYQRKQDAAPECDCSPYVDDGPCMCDWSSR
jgi:hypothetical protein